jgi:hypothetical protein
LTGFVCPKTIIWGKKLFLYVIASGIDWVCLPQIIVLGQKDLVIYLQNNFTKSYFENPMMTKVFFDKVIFNQN